MRLRDLFRVQDATVSPERDPAGPPPRARVVRLDGADPAPLTVGVTAPSRVAADGASTAGASGEPAYEPTRLDLEDDEWLAEELPDTESVAAPPPRAVAAPPIVAEPASAFPEPDPAVRGGIEEDL